MASLGPLPFLLKASSSTGKKTPTFLTRALHRGNSGAAAHRRTLLFDSNGGFHRMGRIRTSRRARAIGTGGSIGDEEIGNGNDDDDDDDDDGEVGVEEGIADDALRATIRTSKKVLARQRDLLQQIAERRKLISSVKHIDNLELDDATLDESFGFLLNQDISSTSQNFGPTVEAHGDFLSGGEKFGSSLVAEHSLGDARGLQGEANVGAAQPKVMPPFLTDASELYGVEEAKHVDTEESIARDVSMEHDAVRDEEKLDSPPLAGVDVMNIILVSAECAPWSKTGGLGDVAGALPKALARRGHRVMVVAPRYADYSETRELGERRRYNINGQDMEVAYFHAFINGVDFVFIESPIFRHLGNDIYGGDRVNILKRMILLCKAAVEVQWHVPCGGICYGDGNLVFIANDWHTALLPVYLKAYYRDNGFMNYARCILVIHNIAHQGRGPLDDFHYVDLPGHYMELFKLYDPLGGDHFNIFAAGLKTADRVVTVSYGYAWELKTPDGGWGLHEIINENDWKFQGIVNGIDTKDWNPRSDIHLKSDGYTNYSLETLHAGKSQCKAALQRELGLAVRDDVPILSFIGRLDNQKGVDLIAEAVHWIVGQDAQLIMLGSGRPDLEDTLRRLEGQHRDKVRSWVGFSVKMAHRITAGADVLLMPSRFEPCGLNQLYAMMYGTVPVVHAVGGLRDTVIQFDPHNETGLGWTFKRAEVNRLIDALGHCLNTYRNYKSSWEGLQRRGMMQDLSWDNAAQQYEQVLVAAKYQW